MVLVREAQKKDIPTIMIMEHKLFSVWDRMDPVDKINHRWFGTPKHIKEIEKAIHAKNKKLYVASINNKVIGYLRCNIPERTQFQDLIGHIQLTYVDPQQRNKGIAKELTKRASAWFKQKKLKWMTVGTHAKDRGANDFWKKQKFVIYNHTYKKKINQ